MEEIPNNHLTCMKPVVNNGIFTISTGESPMFLVHQQYEIYEIQKQPNQTSKSSPIKGLMQLAKGSESRSSSGSTSVSGVADGTSNVSADGMIAKLWLLLRWAAKTISWPQVYHQPHSEPHSDPKWPQVDQLELSCPLLRCSVPSTRGVVHQ